MAGRFESHSKVGTLNVTIRYIHTKYREIGFPTDDRGSRRAIPKLKQPQIRKFAKAAST